MKRLVLVATAAVAISLVPAPAFAASANIPNLSSGAVVQNTITVQCQGSGSSGISKVELFINGSLVSKNAPGGVQNSASTSYSWTTNGLRNGGYGLRCTATENSGASDSQSINVTVDNAPSTPSGVNASANGDTITVTWNSNPEPDITGYRVERDSGGGFAGVATVGGTSYSESPGPGNHAYRVVAIRNSTISGGKASGPSGSSSAYIAPPPDPGPGDPGTPGDPGSGTGGGNTGGNTGGGNAGGGWNGGGGGWNGGGNNGNGNNGGNGGGFPGFGSPASNDPFVAGGRRVGQVGLPSFNSLTLPGVRRPATLQTEGFDWGTYDEELPYASAPGGGQPKVFEDQFQTNRGIAAISPDRIIPPDGLRWVAAIFLRFMAQRIDSSEEQIVEAALADIKASEKKRAA
jgi:hypothetical protein